MTDNVSQIKERLNVVDVLSGYIKLQKSGVNYKARCPFHNEKSPSFYISPERQIWHCFGCQKGGDMFSFVQEIEGIEFPEALRILAQRAGVKIEKFDSSVQDKKSVLYEICETATRFFEKQLHHSVYGKKALIYLKNRGLDDATIKEFRLGFAPDDWHALSNFLRNCDYKDSDIVTAGVSLKREDGSDMYDRFRSRIVFPIANINDQVVGFTGRIFVEQGISKKTEKEEGAKYINTPQTPIYDKSRILYGLNKAKIESRQLDRCLLVEGNMDAIMSYQAGVKNVAATSGTALTSSHLQLLQRYTNNLDFCFDTDQAGLIATRRGIGLALSQNFNIKIVYLNDPGCKDPADYVKKFVQLVKETTDPENKSRNKWQELTQSAKPVIDFYFDKLNSELDISSVQGKKAMLASLGPLIKRLASKVERSHWISKLSAVLKTRDEAVEADILSFKDDLDSYSEYQVKDEIVKKLEPELPKDDIYSEALLAVIIKNPILFAKDIANVRTELLDSDTVEIINNLKESDLAKFKFDDFLKKFDDSKRMKLEFANLKAQELLKEFSDEELLTEFVDINKKLERRSVSAQLAGLELEIKAAEAVNDKKKLMPLLTKFSDLSKKLN